jgi:hypothetical protein
MIYITEITMHSLQCVKFDGELDISTADNVLNFEIHKSHIKAYLLNNSSVSLGSHETVILTLGSRADYFSYDFDNNKNDMIMVIRIEICNICILLIFYH